MTGLLAHADAPALIPSPLLVLLAGAAVLAPARLLRGRAEPPERSAVAGPVAARPAVTGGILLALLAVAVWAVATAPRPGPPLGWAWLAVTVASLALGRVWQAANPLRLLARLVDPGEAGVVEPPGRLAGAMGAGGVLLLGWLQHAPLSSAAAAGALGAYVAVHVLAGLRWGTRWFARAEAVEVYGTLVADAARPPAAEESTAGSHPAAAAGLGVLAALVAVPLQARLADQALWMDLTGGLGAGARDLAAAGLLLCLAVVAFAALRAAARGPADGPLAAAVVGLFASHQVALLTRPPLATGADLAATDPRLVAATLLPLLVLLAGVARASHLLAARTRHLSARRAGAVRTPALALLGALAVVATLLAAVPL